MPNFTMNLTSHANAHTTMAVLNVRYSTCAPNDHVNTTACAHLSHHNTTNVNARMVISARIASDRIHAKTRLLNAQMALNVKLTLRILVIIIAHVKVTLWASIVISVSHSLVVNIAIIVWKVLLDLIVIF